MMQGKRGVLWALCYAGIVAVVVGILTAPSLAYSTFDDHHQQQYAPIELRVEYLSPNPVAQETGVVGIDVIDPRFSWQLPSISDKRGHHQTSYRLIVEKVEGK